MEFEVYPRQLSEPVRLGRTLCVAPHPDDEILGCGGLLALLARLGLASPSLILTKGERSMGERDLQAPSQKGVHQNAPHQISPDKPDESELRADESRAAAIRLGLPVPNILDLGDRQLRFEPLLIDLIVQSINSEAVETLLLPSLSEPHPDHQVCALAGLAAAGRVDSCQRVLFYEDGATMHPNRWFDIDDVASLKWDAIDCFSSQLEKESYADMARALARVRAFGLRRNTKPQTTINAAEAFFELDLKLYRAQGPLAALPQWPWIRRSLDLANDPADLPMVHVLVRSMNRSCLLECLASIAAQTYRPLRVMIVNASGTPHRSIGNFLGAIPVEVLESRGDVPLARAQAANRLLEALCDRVDKNNNHQNFGIFIDDDDLIDPSHIERLVSALSKAPASNAAYTGVRLVDQSGETLSEYDVPWSYERLVGINFIPIHAVLFRVDAVLRTKIRFKEELPVLEDWAFWRSLAKEKGFSHCPGVTATYRQNLGDSHVSDPSHQHYWRLWHGRLIAEAVSDANEAELSDWLQWHALALEEARGQLLKLAAREAQLADAQRALEESVEQIGVLKQKISSMLTEHAQLKASLERQVDLLLGERSRFGAQFSDQALHYEREITRLQRQAAGEATSVMALQAQLHDVSELAKRNFETASALQKELASEHQRAAGASKDMQALGDELHHLKNYVSLIEQSRSWRLIQKIKRWLGLSAKR